MNEYIERESIKKSINSLLDMVLKFTHSPIEIKQLVFDVIDEERAADVQSVKHGRWIDCSYYDACVRNEEQDIQFKCSNCGHKIYNKPNDDNLFCGHCSAKMDLKDGEKE